MMHRTIFLFCLLAVAALFSGCGDTPKSYTVEVNGYGCRPCNAKFYTTGGVSAQQCPQCKSGSIQEVATYTCPADKTKNVAIINREGVPCSQCKALVSASTYPTEEELKQWGAAKKSKAEVGGS